MIGLGAASGGSNIIFVLGYLIIVIIILIGVAIGLFFLIRYFIRYNAEQRAKYEHMYVDETHLNNLNIHNSEVNMQSPYRDERFIGREDDK